jgi:8-oxo-dGTP diphosphatase
MSLPKNSRYPVKALYHPSISFSMQPRTPALTVDGILIEHDSVLLVQRKHEPFQGKWALPGGFVEYGEKTEDAVIREMNEETGLTTVVRQIHGVYSDPHRDPRGHTVTVVYLLKRASGELHAGDDASTAKFFKINRLPELAFDHAEILKDVLRRMSHGVLSEM